MPLVSWIKGSLCGRRYKKGGESREICKHETEKERKWYCSALGNNCLLNFPSPSSEIKGNPNYNDFQHSYTEAWV